MRPSEGAADRVAPAGTADQAQRADSLAEPAEAGKQAERRTGELLKDLARADKPNPDGRNQHEVASDGVTQPRQPSPYAEALQSTGISRQTALRSGLSQSSFGTVAQ